jgi:hypothetical protein
VRDGGGAGERREGKGGRERHTERERESENIMDNNV